MAIISRQLRNFSSVLLQSVAWPYIELAIRLWIARLFFTFGVLQLMHWQATLALAGVENLIPFIAPGPAAYFSTVIDLTCATLLGLGLMTRYAALPLLALSFITQFRYKPVDTQLFWTVLFGWFVVHGSGPLSLDSLLRRGLGGSAVPLIPRIIGFSKQLRALGTPFYTSTIGLWLGAALLLSAISRGSQWGLQSLERWLPLDVVLRIPRAAALLGGCLLILGLMTRYVAIALLVSLFAYSMIDPRVTDAVYLLMLLAILGVYGGGCISLDHAIEALRARRARKENAPRATDLEHLPRVVIVGAGFGGLCCAEALRTERVSVTLIDRNNYHLFQPLLYQVATAALSPADIAMPARPMFREHPRTRLLLGTVTGVDTKRQMVSLESGEIPYDYLVLATGATHSYFGNDQWAAHAPGLKGIGDALSIRRRILTAFERAEATVDQEERAALLTFVIVGGGPTGVELAGAIAELARFGLEGEFRAFDPAQTRVVLVQAAPRVLPTFPERLSAIAQQSLERLGVKVRLNDRVDHIDESGVAVGGMRIASRTVLWAAGVNASPAAVWLNATADRAGRVIVSDDLTVPGFPNVFAIGDTALSKGWRGENVPGLAPAAKQGGAYVASRLRATFEGRKLPSAFRYRHLGSLATIGRKAAVADFGTLQLWGAPAWWLWGIVHIGFMLGIRNRIATLTNWFWAYLKFGGGIRLITGD